MSATAPPAAPRRRSVVPLGTIIRYLALVAVSIVVLAPVYFTVVGSLQPGERLLDFPRSLWPGDVTLSVYREAWSEGNLGRYLLNSAVVAVVVTAGQVVTSVLAAYAFVFLPLRARALWFGVFLATLLVPSEVTIIANRETIETLGWIDTYQALTVPFLAAAFGTFLLRQVFRSIPRDLVDAAAVDGIGHRRFLWDVCVPLARPTIGALALLAFLGAWNQYLWPLLVTNDESARTVQIGLRQLARTELDQFNLVMAGNVLAALPIVVVLLLFQRQLVRGLTAGAVKG